MSPTLGDETALARQEVAYFRSSRSCARWLSFATIRLIQALLFLIERFEFVILASSSAVCRGRRRDPVSTCSVPARRQPLCHVSNSPQRPTLHHRSARLRMWSSLLIHRAWSDHLITGLLYFLECHKYFAVSLARASDKNVIAMHRPRDGAQLIVEAATRHSANGETATDEPFSQLISPRCCSWASSVQRLAQLPNIALSGIRQGT